MPPGYPYNMDPNYGPVSMVSEDGKLPAPQSMIKEERLKESPSPNEISKSQLQVKFFNEFDGITKEKSETHKNYFKFQFSET